MAERPLKVLLLVFPGFNTLDLNGPVEVLGSSSMADKHHFTITVAAASETTEAFENVLIKRHVSFVELLNNDSSGRAISSYDILILPGGPSKHVHQVIDSGGDGFLEVVKAFASLEENSNRQKWLVSICTAAGFLGTLGLLAGYTVTSHWAYLDRLQSVCEQVSKERGLPPTTVVRKRWVDAGSIEGSIRLVTAGGVSCGIDCILWMVGELYGLESARTVAKAMDYDWKFGNIAVTQGEMLSPGSGVEVAK